MKSIKHYNKLLSVLLLLFFSTIPKCEVTSSNEKSISPPVSDKAITSFTFEVKNNPNLPSDLSCDIIERNIITITPYSTDLSSLVPSFTTTETSVKVNGVEQISGLTTNDFTYEVTYTAITADASIQHYKVFVIPASEDEKNMANIQQDAI